MPARPLRAVPDEPEGVVLYIRQSITRRVRDDEGRKTSQLDTVSPELQETAGRDYCARQGYRIVAIVTDLNRTGRTLRRRKVQEAIGYLERGEASVIVVWKWSRMSRNRRDWAITCDHIEDKVGGRMESSTEPVDVTTAVGRFSRGMLAELAAFESDRAGEVFKEVMDDRVSKGLPGNGRDRFGYVNVGKGRFEPHPELGDVLASMYRRYIAGDGYKTIARWLNDHGHRTVYGGIWREGTVKSVLDSGFGAAQFVHRGKHRDGAHKAVITEQEWEQYQTLRDERSHVPSRTKGSRYVLTGLVRCGLCGASMVARRDRYGHVSYRCPNRSLTECTNPYVRLKAVEGEVLGWLSDKIEDIDRAAETARQVQAKVVTYRHQAEVLARKVQQQELALQRLTVERAQGMIEDDATYLAARDEITALRDRLRGEHDEVLRTAGAGTRFDVDTYRGLLQEWDTMPVAQRREMIRQFLARVRVWGKPFRVQPVPVWEDGQVPTTDSDPRPTTRDLTGKVKALTDDQVREIRRRHTAGESQMALARAFKVSSSTVHHVVHRITYRTVPDSE